VERSWRRGGARRYSVDPDSVRWSGNNDGLVLVASIANGLMHGLLLIPHEP
jgi:hypothetical protein